MVEAARPGAPANDPNDADQNSFHIIHNFFRDRLFKYFDMIHQNSCLIMEDSLYQVIMYLLNPKADSQPFGVKKYCRLTNTEEIQMPNLGRETIAQVYIVRPELESVQMVIDQLLLQDPIYIKDAHILFVPRRTIECDELLVEQKHLIEARIG